MSAIHPSPSPSGLSPQQVADSRLLHGENILTPPRRRSLWHLYAEKYADPIIRILIVAALISLGLAFISGQYVETIGIIAAIFFATTVGFYFERDATRKFDVLTALGEELPVKVRRDGKVQQIARREVVVGDIVLIETGDEIPADGRLLKATDLQVDESSLTGEPVSTKSAGPSASASSPSAAPDAQLTSDSHAYPPDVVLRSSMVMSGTATFVVTAVGDQTEIGQVAREATELSAIKTPLNQQLDLLAKLISKVGSAVSVLAFVSFLVHDILTGSIWHTDDYVGMATIVLRYFMMAVTLIVMAVPEGLPMAITLAMALNMRRMLKTNILVRKLASTETMGAVTVICTDKTGTLTQNRMTVGELYVTTDADSRLIDYAIAVNSTAEVTDGNGIGNPTEVALLRHLQTDYRALRADATVLSQTPFSTERKYMQTTARLADGATHTFVKGAPEIVLDGCQWNHPEEYALVTKKLATWQRQAMRTLAFTCDGRFLAVTGISDPVREDVPKAVNKCRSAGIEVKIVTGDTQATAMEIARQIGILTPASPAPAPAAAPSSTPAAFAPTSSASAPSPASPSSASCLSSVPYGALSTRSSLSSLSGAAFSALSDEEALQQLPDLKVLFRARPADKQRLVQLLQRQGQVVAVTGDGTNDAPALNHAHIGISLGSGTSVAKHASDVTILDDSFRSVVKAVEWGRAIYRNIQRFLFFQLTVNVTALLLVLGGSLIGTELPLTVTQILWINLIMDTFAAMALASLPSSSDVMGQPPRQPGGPIITRPLWRAIIVTGLAFFAVSFVYLYWLEHNAVGTGVSTYELTKFFTVFVMMQWWNLFNARALLTNARRPVATGSAQRPNHRYSPLRWLLKALPKGFVFVTTIILVGQWAIVQWGGTMFRTVPLSLNDWLQIIAATSVVFIVPMLGRRLFAR
jgi:Ca2+-transporting ATPase